jgi:tRNA pseudouridine55 synthase
VRRFAVAPGPEPGVVRISVDCSSGTYVRSLAADLGAALGGGAHLRHLRRTAVGSFTLADALPLEKVDRAAVLSPAEAMRDLRRVVVGEEAGGEVVHGRPLARDAARLAGEGPWALLDGAGRLLAVYEAAGDRARAAVVVAPADA